MRLNQYSITSLICAILRILELLVILKLFPKFLLLAFSHLGVLGGEALWKDAALGLNPVFNQTDLVVLMHGIS